MRSLANGFVVPPELGGCGRPRGRPPAAGRRGRRDSTIRPRAGLPDARTGVARRRAAARRRCCGGLGLSAGRPRGPWAAVRRAPLSAASCSAASGDEPRRRARVITSATLRPAACWATTACGSRSNDAVGAAGQAAAQAGGAERPKVALGVQTHHGEVRRGRREARRVHGRAGADGPRRPRPPGRARVRRLRPDGRRRRRRRVRRRPSRRRTGRCGRRSPARRRARARRGGRAPAPRRGRLGRRRRRRPWSRRSRPRGRAARRAPPAARSGRGRRPLRPGRPRRCRDAGRWRRPRRPRASATPRA